jgi:signal peptidase I
MDPTIKAGELVTVDRSAYGHSTPQRWDIVLFQFPQSSDTLALLRIVGLPGETIVMDERGLVVDGTSFDGPPGRPGIKYSGIKLALANERIDFPFRVPQDSYWVLGDNPDHAKDSRFWGELSVKCVLGRVIDR